MFYVGLLVVLSCCLALGEGYRKTTDPTAAKRPYQIQNGLCSYTFLLPEQDNCKTPSSTYTNLVQKDDPAEYDESVQRLEQLENIIENNTQWLLKLENYIQESMKQEMFQIQQNAVHNHTAAMIEFGTNLLSQTVEQTRKLTNVEEQKGSINLSESDIRLFKVTNTSYLEKRVGEMEEKRQVELKTLKEEKEQLFTLILRQTAVIEELEQQLLRATTNNSALQQQQQELLETVNNLISTISIPTGGGNKPTMMQDTPTTYPDCAAVYKSGNTDSGVYSLTLPNTTQEIKVELNSDVIGPIQAISSQH
ncbi:hypothetical protein J4Q44_G00004650 [Coregonus suidteri]|uniref:Angiopoietin-1/2/4 domain-containing protein n=1 Tax=Coregonus suidteri TaxID=861788 RepID=A0AAN8MMI4_9TELE